MQKRENKTKNVLIIAYFNPYLYGSRRVLGLAKYLIEFGWQPIILTAPLYKRPDPKFKVIEAPEFPKNNVPSRVKVYDENTWSRLQKRNKIIFNPIFKSFFRKLYLWFYKAIVDYPDAEKNWKYFAIKKGNELLKKGDISAIISIWPTTSHIIAKELKSNYNIPWIADFPDPWSQNHNYLYGAVRKIIDRRLELNVISYADALTTVTPYWAENLKLLHKGKPVYTITHGFDPKLINDPPVRLTEKFTITYTGAVYFEKQSTSKFFTALKEILSKSNIDPNDFRVRFYGTKYDWIEREIKEYGLSNNVKQCGRVTREKSLEKQRESQVLLILNWEDQQDKGVCASKVYEYLAAKRPILATGGFGGDLIDEVINETNAGFYTTEIEDIKNTLLKFYFEYKNKGSATCNGNQKIHEYTEQKMAKKFAEILDDIID